MMILKELPNCTEFIEVFIKNDAETAAAGDDNNYKYL